MAVSRTRTRTTKEIPQETMSMTMTMRKIRHATAVWRELVDLRRGDQVVKVHHLYESTRRGDKETCVRSCGAPAFEVTELEGKYYCVACLRLLTG